MFAMDIEDDILLSVNDICDFVELDGNIVASDTFEFKLPCGSITFMRLLLTCRRIRERNTA